MPKTASPPVFDPAQAENVRPYVEKILNSEAFRKTPNLRSLLDYLVAKSNEGQTDHLKESVIAIDVFHRRTNFDGRLDNIVRVQAHRLRKLLETYYAEEGKDDKVRLSVPPGGYVPQFIVLHEPGTPPDPTPILLPEAFPYIEAKPAAQGRFPVAKVAGYAGLFLAGVLLTMLFGVRERTPSVDSAVAEIWQGIFEPGVKLVVSYTNPVFLRVGHSRTYLMYQGPLSAPSGTQINIADTDPGIDPQYKAGGQPLFFGDGWTGTGEVLGVNRLTEIGAQFKTRLTVIPSRALALNEVRSANVVFLGSPWMNGVLAQVGNETTPIYNSRDGRIVIRNPRKGEPQFYENVRDPVTSEIKACFALFSVLPGMDALRRVVSSAGIGTWATWGGLEFVTTPAGAAQLVSAVKAANGGNLPRFYQAVIRTEIIKGTASNESLVATRVVQP